MGKNLVPDYKTFALTIVTIESRNSDQMLDDPFWEYQYESKLHPPRFEGVNKPLKHN